MCLKGKTVMITGASGGIGRELSVRLAKMGANLILFGGKNLEKLNKTAELVKEFGVKVKTVGGDITDEKFIEDNFLASVNEFDSLDVLINNAGLSFNANVENTPLETFDKIVCLENAQFTSLAQVGHTVLGIARIYLGKTAVVIRLGKTVIK